MWGWKGRRWGGGTYEEADDPCFEDGEVSGEDGEPRHCSAKVFWQYEVNVGCDVSVRSDDQGYAATAVAGYQDDGDILGSIDDSFLKTPGKQQAVRVRPKARTRGKLRERGTEDEWDASLIWTHSFGLG